MRDISERLKAAREALGLSQQALADRVGVSLRSQQNYEKGERNPDSAYLAALAEAGADVLYLLTGKHDKGLSAEEKLLLEYFREASKEVKRAAMGALLGAAQAPHIGGNHSQHSSGDGAIQIGSIGSAPARRRRQ